MSNNIKFQNKQRIIQLFSVIITLFVCLALNHLYKYHFLYIENSRIFLFASNYFKSTIFTPAGFAIYLTNFFVQFYYLPLGVFLIALLLLLLQLGFLRVYRVLFSEKGWYAVTWIPSLLYVAFIAHNSAILTDLLSTIIAVWSACLFIKINKPKLRFVLSILVIPIIWFAVGNGVVMFVSLLLVSEWIIREKRSVGVSVGIIVSVLLTAFSALYFFPQLQNQMLLYGSETLYPSVIAMRLQNIVWFVVILSLIFFLIIPQLKNLYVEVALVTLILIGAGAFTKRFYRKREEVTYHYLYSVRTRNWDDVLELAKKEPPLSPLHTNCTNLALAEKNMMQKHLADFYQKGTAGLLLDDENDMLIGGEILFNLGFANEAQRYASEVMTESTSVAGLKRIAETNLVTGRTQVARKYLNLLRHTLFYRSWANEMLLLCSDSIALNKHPLYGNLYRFQPVEDVEINHRDISSALNEMVRQHPDNQLAVSYLWAAQQLSSKRQPQRR